MPIAKIFTKQAAIEQSLLDWLAENWASQIEVELKDIHITVILNCQQAGQSYGLLVELLLPSLWSDQKVEQIGLSLHQQLLQAFNLQESDVFIVTSMIPAGQVIEDGRVLKW